MINKKGQIANKVTESITLIILVVVLFLMFAQLVPEAQQAGDTLDGSGVPLGSLFTGDGVLILMIMAGLVFTTIRLVISNEKK